MARLQDASFNARSSYDDAEDPLFRPVETNDGKTARLNATAKANYLTIGSATNWPLPSMDKNGDQAALSSQYRRHVV